MTYRSLIYLSLMSFCLAGCGSSKNTSRGSVISLSSSSSSSSSSTSNSSSSSSSTSTSSSSSSTSSGVVASCNANDFLQPADIQLQQLVPDGSFVQPTAITFLPDNDSIFFVLQQDGVIWRMEQAQGELSQELFVDLRDFYNVVYLPEGPGGCNECGLFSMAFHPEFADNGYIYLSFTEDGDPGNPLQSYVARFRSDDGGRSLLLGEDGLPWRENIYHVQQPTRSHNNGQVKFGPDNYLYVSFGDGGPAYDFYNNAQNVENPFGAILRLNDDGSPAPGNLVEGGLPEIFAYGLRNPWHWSFDRETGKLWVGDVGQARVEEINVIVNGGNYGWSCFEGERPLQDCGSDGPFIQPVVDYPHKEGRSVTGGYVYRGASMPELYGSYIYGDFGSGMIWALSEQEPESFHRIQLLASGKYISAFSEDGEGELYLTDYAGGSIFKIVPAEPDPTRIPLPQKLSATGCVDVQNPAIPAEKLIAYDIIEPFWSDTAAKERFFAIPEGQKIEVEDDGDFIFPQGTVLVKNFRLDGQLIETRLMLNQEGTGWSGFSYEWNQSQTDAHLLESGKNVNLGDQVWRFPGPAECSQCHTSAAGFSLGLEVRQLNKMYTYNNGETVNQLDYLEKNGFFEQPLSSAQRDMALAGSQSQEASLEARALSYLHANCSQCHRPGGTTQASTDFTAAAGLPFMNACEKQPLQGNLGFSGSTLLTPGDHAASLMWRRIAHDEDFRMPPLASNVLDRRGADLIRDWIDSLTECTTIAGPEDAQFVVTNKLSQTVLTIDGSSLVLSEGAAGHSWEVEVWNGFYRLKNAQQPEHFIHTQTLPPTASPVLNGWWSAQWSLEPVGEYFRVSNRWRGGYLYADGNTGALRLGPLPEEQDAALWSFEVEQ